MSGPTYGKKGGQYLVRPGDVWAVGAHLVACGDLETGDGARFLAWAKEWSQLKPALFYSDPPWSPAFITRFRKGAGVEQQPEHTVESLVRTIADLAAPCPLFIEMGTTYHAELIYKWVGVSRWTPGMWYEFWPITYSGKPATLYLFGGTQPAPLSFRGVDDSKTPALAIESYSESGQVVVDLCLGLGCTARAAASLGRRSWGLELHPRRCSSTLADLAKMTGQQPMNVGSIR